MEARSAGVETSPPHRFRFRRADRLLTSADFSSVFDRNEFRSSHKHALLLARNSSGKARLGMVIGKKHVRLSVARHRIKRILREQFRLNRDLFSGLDVVLVARTGLDNLSNAEMADALMKLIHAVQRQKNRQASA